MKFNKKVISILSITLISVNLLANCCEDESAKRYILSQVAKSIAQKIAPNFDDTYLQFNSNKCSYNEYNSKYNFISDIIYKSPDYGVNIETKIEIDTNEKSAKVIILNKDELISEIDSGALKEQENIAVIDIPDCNKRDNSNQKSRVDSKIDCNAIFQERKDELLYEIESLKEEREALESYKSATNSLLDRREEVVKKREAEVEKILEKIESKEERIEKLLGENRKALEEIKKLKDSKVGETFAKMKASKAAPILNEMQESKAASILFNLDPKILGKILAKMEPTKASNVINLIKQGPPFISKEEREYNREYLENKLNDIKVDRYSPNSYIDNAKDPEIEQGANPQFN